MTVLELLQEMNVMKAPNEIEIAHSLEGNQSGSSRRSFLKNAAFTGATTFAALGGFTTVAQPRP
jgi:hypothetical protein